MVPNTSSKTYTYAEYLNCDLDIEQPHELVAGKIVIMPSESPLNMKIALQLIVEIAEIIGIERISNKTEIIVTGSKVTARVPDITVFSEAGVAEINLKTRSTIDIDMLPPILVVEVVSPGKANRDRDYRFKRSEYAARGIKYYWIVDPQEQNLTCLKLIDGLYEDINGNREDKIITFNEPFALKIDLEDLFGISDSFSSLQNIASRPPYREESKTIEQMNAAVDEEIRRNWKEEP